MIAIDLGSNTIRFVEYDGIKWGNSFEKIVRTAENIESTGIVSTNAVERIINAISEARTHLNFEKQTVVGVTTAAIRMAANKEWVLKEIAIRTHIHFMIIDGNTEAKLTLLAVQNRLDILEIVTQDFILVDIGGASTEITIVNGDYIDSVSFNVGILTMNDKLHHGGLLSVLLSDFESDIIQFLQSFDGERRRSTLVLTAGTPTTIVAYKLGMSYDTYLPDKVNGSLLTLKDCMDTYTDLMQMEESQRSYYVGVGREGLITTGILMVESIFRAIGVEEGIVIDDGLREGVALNYFFNDELPHLT